MATVKAYKRQSLVQLAIVLGILVLVNVLAGLRFARLDLTQEKRYSISASSKQLLRDLDDIVYFEVYLDGELPAEYKRLQRSISEMLEEYNAYSGRKIEYRFLDPFSIGTREEVNQFVKSLTEKGINPRPIAEQRLDEVSQRVLIPGAIAYYKEREVTVNFLPDQKALNEDAAAVVGKGISMLEYHLSSAIIGLQQVRPVKVAVIQGHGELPARNVADLMVTLQQHQMEVVFTDLTRETIIDPLTDLIIIPKPTLPFEEQSKFKIDQYIMRGGKAIWLLDGMRADLDSLSTGAPQFVSTELDLNLADQLFTYGVRINRDLILDREANRIPMFSQGGQVRNYYPWPFFPIVFPEGNHPITKHLDPIMVRFASTIDTIKVEGVKKSILLHSSAQSTAWKAPVQVRLELAMNPPLAEAFSQQHLPMAVLLEGEFRSLYRGRVPKAFLDVYQDSLGHTYRDQSRPTRMIVISDGDLIKNDIDRNGRIQLLGAYPFNPGVLFANKDFLVNCVYYLTDSYGIIGTRSKEFKVRPMDREKLREESWKWQFINLIIPALSLLLFAGVYNFIRKKRYEGKV